MLVNGKLQWWYLLTPQSFEGRIGHRTVAFLQLSDYNGRIDSSVVEKREGWVEPNDSDSIRILQDMMREKAFEFHKKAFEKK